MFSKWHPDQTGGLLSVVLGGIVLLEAWRIKQMSGSHFLGDHTLPALLGGVLILLGLVMVFLPDRRVSPSRQPRISRRLFGTVASMFAYVLLIGQVGYGLSTFFAALLLFRVIGAYAWRACFGYSLLVTGVLYLVFVYGLQIALPRGVLW